MDPAAQIPPGASTITAQASCLPDLGLPHVTEKSLRANTLEGTAGDLPHQVTQVPAHDQSGEWVISRHPRESHSNVVYRSPIFNRQ